MSIDLSKAKVGDKFRTRVGLIFTYSRRAKSFTGGEFHLLYSENGMLNMFLRNGHYLIRDANALDLVEQVFDKGDLLDNNISAEEGVQAIVEMAKNEYEKAKELGVAIQNLPLIVEQQKEENLELQRRQEVVEVVNELFTRGTMTDWYCELIKHGKTKKTYLEWILGWAEEFVSTREKYLKEGKLC